MRPFWSVSRGLGRAHPIPRRPRAVRAAGIRSEYSERAPPLAVMWLGEGELEELGASNRAGHGCTRQVGQRRGLRRRLGGRVHRVVVVEEMVEIGLQRSEVLGGLRSTRVAPVGQRVLQVHTRALLTARQRRRVVGGGRPRKARHGCRGCERLGARRLNEVDTSEPERNNGETAKASVGRVGVVGRVAVGCGRPTDVLGRRGGDF